MKLSRQRSLFLLRMEFAVFALCATIAAGEASPKASGAPGRQPNVIWILMDAARADHFSCLGYDRATTPNLDNLAKEGALFVDNYSQGIATPTSVPSFMTGRFFPVRCAQPVQSSDVRRIRPSYEQLVPKIFSEKGYHTVLITSHPWFPPYSPLARAFDEAFFLKPSKEDSDGGLTYAPLERLRKATVDYLHDYKGEKPLFFYIHTVDTHWPFVAPAPFDKWVKAGMPEGYAQRYHEASRNRGKMTPEDVKYLRGLYDGNLAYADWSLGNLFKDLETMGAWDHTLVVVGADHGEMLGEDPACAGHGPKTYDTLMHVPLIMKGPGIPPGRRVEALTQNADITPTLVDLLELKTDARFDGKTLRPLLADPASPPPHEYLFCYVPGMKDVHIFVLRDANYKLEMTETFKDDIVPDNSGSPNVPLPLNKEEELLKADVWKLWKLPEPGPQRVNCIGDFPKVAEKMKKYMLDKIAPLVDEYFALPPEAYYFTLSESKGRAEPAEAYIDEQQVSDAGRKDGKWSFAKEYQFLYAAPKEKVPPLTVTLKVSDGNYAILVEMLTLEDYCLAGPASALSVAVDNDPPRDVSWAAPRQSDPDHNNYRMVHLGTHAVTGGQVRLTFRKTANHWWAVVRRIKMIPVEDATPPSSESVPGQNEEERKEQLKSLGYL